MLSTDTKRQRRLTYFPDFYEYADKPVWSPDGSKIAFTYSPRTDPGQLPATEIRQVDPGGTNPRELVTHDEGESLLDPSWSPDGKYLYFTVDTSASLSTQDSAGALGMNVRIDRLDVATGVRSHWKDRAQMPGSDGPGGETVYLEYVEPSGSDEGLIAPPQRLMSALPDGGSPRQVVDDKAFQAMYAPRMSPDGKWVVFAAVNVPPPSGTKLDILTWLGLAPRTAAAHGLPWDLYLVPASGGAATRLTKLDEDQPFPIWLDNSTIAFMGTTGLYRVGIDAGGNPAGAPEKLHPGAPHGGLTWLKP
jgi:Tol biopolymer transport system component